MRNWLLVVLIVGCRTRTPEAIESITPTAPLVTVQVPERDGGGEGPAPLRRLTNSQYLNALADVFGETTVELEAFPADTIIAGFDNAAEGQSPSDLRVARYQRAAQKYAEAETRDAAHVRQLTGCSSWATAETQAACIDSLLHGKARLLFRRPLTDEELQRFRSRATQWQAQTDFEGAVQLLVEALLQSPQFLYRPETVTGFDDYARASRLSFLLWDSVPDEALLSAAATHALSTPEQLRAQAARMLSDTKSHRAMWNFHRQWLNLERVLLQEHSQRTPEVDAAWTAQTQAAVLDESQRFVTHVMQNEGTLTALLTSRAAWLDAETSRLYGMPALPPDSGIIEAQLPEGQRSGILTRAAFLAGFSHRGATSPPIRGNEINLRLLCRLPNPPPPGLDTTPPMSDGGMRTNRMLFEERTAPHLCAGCHITLNGFGFGFENFSASGAFQATDHGLPVDATGHISGTDVDGPFTGALELSTRLSASQDVATCATQMWVRYALGRDVAANEQPWVDDVTAQFISGGGDVKQLLQNLVATPSFAQMTSEEP